MTPLQRLLLIPCLSPLLLTLLVGGLNMGKSGSLRILTWELPTLPIGVWMAVAATTGAVLGSGGALTAASNPNRSPLQREVRRPFAWQEDAATTTEQRQPSSVDSDTPWPERDVRDPAPTVSVPFRVVRTGRAAPNNDQTSPETASKKATTNAASSTPVTNDWDQPLSDEW